MYLLLKDFNFSEENIDFIESQIEEIKQVAIDNKYIKFSDSDTTQALNILKALTPSKILSE
jgi:hypothetical protein